VKSLKEFAATTAYFKRHSRVLLTETAVHFKLLNYYYLYSVFDTNNAFTKCPDSDFLPSYLKAIYASFLY